MLDIDKDRRPLSAGLISVASQALSPPAQIEVDETFFEGKTILVAVVAEAPASAKRCPVNSNRKAYLQFCDGDWELSSVEEEAFIVGRT